MNKKHLIYSFQYAAVLASVLTFSSCKKDEFTAEQALDIENKRKQFQFDLDEKSKDNEAARANFMMWQARKIDSLQKVNAGGQVFYSVTVVPGGSTAFGQGRFEEVGLSGIDVTVEQYGFVYTEKTVKGIAYFKKPLFSGEANVTVDAQGQGYTSVSYIANLTPDGGVPNDGTVFVGNIIPVFDNDPTKTGADDNMAMISGKALADLDLTDVRSTDGTSVEENVPDGVSFSAVIDVNAPEFKEKYLRENFDEGGIHIGGSGNTPGTGVATKSGFIQRIAYEKASTIARVSNGEYSMMVSATASGLPMKMRYSDFAFDRRYVNNFGNLVEERYLYGPEVGYAVDFTVGTRPVRYDYDVNLAQTDATVTAALTKGTSPFTYTASSGAVWLRPVGGIDVALPAGAMAENRFLSGAVANAVTADNNAGAYLHAPTVAFSAPDLAGGVQTVGTPVMYNFKAQGATATTPAAIGTSAWYNTDLSTTRTGALNLRGVRGISLSTVGSGYSTPPVVTLTPVFPGGEGEGSLQASSSSISYVRVIDGGYGLVRVAAKHSVAPTYVPPAGASSPSYSTSAISATTDTYSEVGEFTGVLPRVFFGNDAPPTGGTLASAGVVANVTIGTVDEITVSNGGAGYTATTANPVGFDFGKDGNVDGEPTFPTLTAVASGAAASLRFVTTGGPDLAVFTNGADGATFPAGTSVTAGSNYVFVPSINIIRANLVAAGPVLGADVKNAVVTALGTSGLKAVIEGNTGRVKSYTLESTNTVAIATIPVGSNIAADWSAVPKTTSLKAEAFISGSGIDNYLVKSIGSNYNNVPLSGLDHGGLLTFGNNEYDYYTFAGTIGGPDGGSIAGGNPIESVTAFANNDGDYAVEFFGATGLAGNPVTYPTAIPVFQSGGSVLSGIRIFTPGVNIAPGTSATSPAVKWRVIPRGYKAATIKSQLTPATITFTIVDGGLGYAVRPDIILTTDKLTYVQTAALNDISNFKYDINASGTITKIEFAPNFAGASAVMSALNNATVAGTLQTPIVTVTPQEAELYDKSSFLGNGNNAFYHFRAGGGAILFGQHGSGGAGTMFGIPTAFDVPVLADNVAWEQYAVDTDNAIMHYAQTASAFGETNETAGTSKAYYTNFTLTPTFGVFANAVPQLVGIAGGTGASAVAELNPANGKVAVVNMVSGGSGFGSSLTFNRNPITTNFTVFGGPDGYKAAGLFETYSGIQYVRDIHYGIGRRIH